MAIQSLSFTESYHGLRSGEAQCAVASKIIEQTARESVGTLTRDTWEPSRCAVPPMPALPPLAAPKSVRALLHVAQRPAAGFFDAIKKSFNWTVDKVVRFTHWAHRVLSEAFKKTVAFLRAAISRIRQAFSLTCQYLADVTRGIDKQTANRVNVSGGWARKQELARAAQARSIAKQNAAAQLRGQLEDLTEQKINVRARILSPEMRREERNDLCKKMSDLDQEIRGLRDQMETFDHQAFNDRVEAENILDCEAKS